MPQLTILVGPPGSGKTTYTNSLKTSNYKLVRISQDDSGKEHLELFKSALQNKLDIVVDRMGFNTEQRFRYLAPAKMAGYKTKIVVLHESYAICLNRCLMRTDHPTIKNEENARSALQTFFTKYERPKLDEADIVEFTYPDRPRLSVVVSDIDGTAAIIDHRRHHVEGKSGRDKNWNAFFKEMDKDTVNESVAFTISALAGVTNIIYCSGRPDSYRTQTQDWLNKNKFPEGALLMRNRHDMRQDSIIKEILLDFEILTTYNIKVWLDDRQQVVDMLRKRNIPVFQVAKGDF